MLESCVPLVKEHGFDCTIAKMYSSNLLLLSNTSVTSHVLSCVYGCSIFKISSTLVGWMAKGIIEMV